MLNEIYEITYKTVSGAGVIRLDCSSPNFNKNLRVVEQNLADTHATEIVYTHRERLDEDFPSAEDVVQLSLVGE